MHRFGLVLPFADVGSTQRLLCVCRSAQAELQDKRELAFTAQRRNRSETWWDQDRIFRLDFPFSKFDNEGLQRFLLTQKARHLRVLRLPAFLEHSDWIERLNFPSSLTELSVELRRVSPNQLGELQRLACLKLWRTTSLDLAVLPTICPNLTSLSMDTITCEGCKGEIVGLDLLTTLRVVNWGKRVPPTVQHLEVAIWGVAWPHLLVTPSNLEEIARTLVTLGCAFPWPGIESWPKLRILEFDDDLGPISWQITHAPALHTFACERNSMVSAALKFPRQLRELRIPASRLHLVIPAEIQRLHLRSFDPTQTSLSDLTGLRYLELRGQPFTESNAPRVAFVHLEEFRLFNDDVNKKNQNVTFQFLTKASNLRKLVLTMRRGGWFSRPIPILPRLETIACDFFNETMFQPQVKHLRIAGPDRRLTNATVLEALEHCEKLESLQIPLRPGLEEKILEKLPLITITKTMSLRSNRLA